MYLLIWSCLQLYADALQPVYHIVSQENNKTNVMNSIKYAQNVGIEHIILEKVKISQYIKRLQLN